MKVTAETITVNQIRSVRADAIRAKNWTLEGQCVAALRRYEDAWLREPIAAVWNARHGGTDAR